MATACRRRQSHGHATCASSRGQLICVKQNRFQEKRRSTLLRKPRASKSIPAGILTNGTTASVHMPACGHPPLLPAPPALIRCTTCVPQVRRPVPRPKPRMPHCVGHSCCKGTRAAPRHTLCRAQLQSLNAALRGLGHRVGRRLHSAACQPCPPPRRLRADPHLTLTLPSLAVHQHLGGVGPALEQLGEARCVHHGLALLRAPCRHRQRTTHHAGGA